jgi:hypothetical protein
MNSILESHDLLSLILARCTDAYSLVWARRTCKAFAAVGVTSQMTRLVRELGHLVPNPSLLEFGQVQLCADETVPLRASGNPVALPLGEFSVTHTVDDPRTYGMLRCLDAHAVRKASARFGLTEAEARSRYFPLLRGKTVTYTFSRVHTTFFRVVKMDHELRIRPTTMAVLHAGSRVVPIVGFSLQTRPDGRFQYRMMARQVMVL